MSHTLVANNLLRIGLGIVLIAHSLYLKLFVFTLPGTAEYFASLGLPALSAYLVFVIEAVAGAALVVGLQSRIAAVAAIPVLLGATWVHVGNGWLFSNAGGGWEYPLFLTLVAIVVALQPQHQTISLDLLKQKPLGVQ